MLLQTVMIQKRLWRLQSQIQTRSLSSVCRWVHLLWGAKGWLHTLGKKIESRWWRGSQKETYLLCIHSAEYDNAHLCSGLKCDSNYFDTAHNYHKQHLFVVHCSHPCQPCPYQVLLMCTTGPVKIISISGPLSADGCRYKVHGVCAQ